MILTSVHKLAIVGCALLLLFGSAVSVAWAQNSIALSVTPTLFNLSVSPGQSWQSTVRVVNTNAFDLTIYPYVLNFAPQGENGTGSFLPVLEAETDGATLAEWIRLADEPVVIPREQSADIPFTVTVPIEAAPGGHFAAIMISTVPPERQPGRVQVRTAQVVTSLLFTRVAGDIDERGSIREFSTTKTLVPSPAIEFSLRFENLGNVHLQPQGDITIFNMWGQERGLIPINHQTHFGNVLPESIRKFTFTWVGETAWFDIGRYRAVATLGYGSDEKQFSTSTTYFWVIPLTQIAVGLLILFVCIQIFIWMIRRYIRRMLALAGVDPTTTPRVKTERVVSVPKSRYQTVTAPVRVGVVDLRNRLEGTSAFRDTLRALVDFVIAYRVFFIGALGFLLIGAVVTWYFSIVFVPERAYEVTIVNPDSSTTISSEEIIYQEQVGEQGGVPMPATTASSSPIIEVVNVSGISGQAAAARILIEAAGYEVSALRSDLERTTTRTVIVYTPEWQAEALALSELFAGALVSAAADTQTQEPGLTVFVGSDFSREE